MTVEAAPVTKTFGFCLGCGAKKLAVKLKDGKCSTCRVLAIQPLPQEESAPPAAIPEPEAQPAPIGKKKFIVYREEIHVSKIEVTIDEPMGDAADTLDAVLEEALAFDAGETTPATCNVLWTKPCCCNYGECITWQVEQDGQVLQESDGARVKELIAKDKES